MGRGPRGILCTRGEKAHTSKRVSVIACDNVISKAKLCDAILAVLGKLNIKNSDFLGNPCYKTHARYFCTCVEKRSTRAKERALSLATIDRSKTKQSGDPKRYFRTFGEKEYASKRQAIVACDD